MGEIQKARASVDEATWLDYAKVRLRVCIVDNDGLANYPSDLLRDDVRLILEALRVTGEDLTAAWVNGNAMREELEAARVIISALRRHQDFGGEVWASIDRDLDAYDDVGVGECKE